MNGNFDQLRHIPTKIVNLAAAGTVPVWSEGRILLYVASLTYSIVCFFKYKLTKLYQIIYILLRRNQCLLCL